MNRLIEICSNLASWNPAGKLPLTIPSLIPSALFFQLQLQTEPSVPAPQRLGSPVRGCILGIQLAQALCYSIIGRRFPRSPAKPS